MQKLFGTDGIRGHVGRKPFTTNGLNALGCALSRFFSHDHATSMPKSDDERPFLFAWDGRQSGDFILKNLAPHFLQAGFSVKTLGLLPTPGLSFMVQHVGAVGGIMISASHNPPTDNGLKIFSHTGHKLDGAEEARIAQLFEKQCTEARQATFPHSPLLAEEPPTPYVRSLVKEAAALNLQGVHLVIDAANGAGSHLACEVLKETGAHITPLACTPSGDNINVNCGATCPEGMQQRVKDVGATLGFALDGDGDRLIVCNHKGQLLDGDQLLAHLALDLKERGMLSPAVVVSTVLANTGLEVFLKQHGIALQRTDVGDRWLAEGMQETGAQLSAEPSGHFLFADEITGDGLKTALRLLHLLSRKEEKTLLSLFTPYQQAKCNIPTEKLKPGVTKNIRAVQEALKEQLPPNTRLVLRPSGTEPVLRLMLEAEKEESCKEALSQARSQLTKT